MAKVLARDMVQRRKRRIGAGQRVVGQRVRNRRIRKGRSVPIRGPGKPVQNAKQQLMPVAAGNQVSSHQVSGMNFSRTEPAFNVAPESSQNGIVSPSESLLYLIPTNPQIFSAAASTAIQYQYYKWKSIDITYVPNAAYDSPGMITLAVIPSVTKAAETYATKDLQSMRDFTTFSAKTGAYFHIRPDMLNKTFISMGYEIEPYSEIDLTQQQYIQGVLALGFDGFTADTDGQVVGTLMVSYDVELIAPLSSSNPTTTSCEFSTYAPDLRTPVAATDAQVQAYLDKWNQPSFEFDAQPDNTTYLVKALYERPYVLAVHLAASTASPGTVTITGAADHFCTVTELDYHAFLGGAFKIFLVRPTRFGSTMGIKAHGAGDTDGYINYSIHHISNREVARLSL